MDVKSVLMMPRKTNSTCFLEIIWKDSLNVNRVSRDCFRFLSFFLTKKSFSPWEKVRTTNFTTSKTKKNIEKVGDDHYIKKIYRSDQNVEKGKDQNIEMCPLVDHYDITTTTKKDFRRCDFTYDVKKDQNVENKNHQLPRAYYLWLPRPVGGWVRVN